VGRIRAHGLQHPSAGLETARGRERHHPRWQREGREAVAEAGPGFVRNLEPAAGGVDALAVGTEEPRGGMPGVDVEIGLSLGDWRGKVAEVAVVQLEHGVDLAALEMIEPAMPPQMMLQIVRALPVGLEPRQPVYALGTAA